MQLLSPRDIKKIFLGKKWFFVLIVLLCFVVYFNSLDNEFVSDDISGILNNQNLDNFFWGLRQQLEGFWVFKSLIFHIFGKSTFAYHAGNIILHTLVTILVYFFVLAISENDRLSTFASLIFAVHPIHTEAVTWISGGCYALYSLFFLVSFLFFYFYLKNERKSLYLICFLVFYCLSVLFKVWALPLILIFFIYEKYVRKEKINWLPYIILALMIVCYFFLRQQGVVSRIAGISQESSVWRNFLITIPHSLTQCIYLLFWPMALSLYHEGEVITMTYIWLARILSLLFLFVLPFVLRRKKIFMFFFFFFLLAISLCLSPIQVAWYVAERYLYLASISFCVLLAYALIWLEEKLSIRRLATILLSIILVLYSARIVIRNQDWQTRASLWFATAKVSPRSPRVHNNLGDIYGGRGDVDNAIKEFEIARQLQPGYADATHNLGNTYFQIGELEKAKKYFLEAIEYNPQLYQSFFSLGVISYEQGDLEMAKNYFLQALNVNPKYESAQQALLILEQTLK